MKIKIIRDTFSKGKLLAKGKTTDLPESEAKILIACGKASKGEPKGKVENASADKKIETPENPKTNKKEA